MTRARFKKLVAEALDSIPARFREAIHNVAVVVEDEPPVELLEEMGISPPDTLLGLYQGTPLPERSWDYGNVLPDRIVIYQRPTEEEPGDDEDIVTIIGETVIHELGHYFGLSEEDLEAIERDYWRARSGGPDGEG
jgi:predicted Zn-dependent protease with MMP-like domain